MKQILTNAAMTVVNDLGEVTWLITRHLELDQMEIEGLNIGLGKFLGG